MKIAAFALVFLVTASHPAFADEWTVNSTRDRLDQMPGDGVCATGFAAPGGAPECTLRAAVQEANARRFAIPRYHQIYLPAGVYLLTIAPHPPEEDQQRLGVTSSAIAIRTGDLDINTSLGVTGVGEGLTIIDGGLTDRVFDIWSEYTGIVRFQNLTIRRGSTTGPGGCLRHRGGRTAVDLFRTTVEGCVSQNQVGGGMLSAGYTEMRRATFRNNLALRGGGFENGNIAFIYDSTFDGNSAGWGGDGGGISNITLHGPAPWMVVRGTTISNNQAGVGGGMLNQGGVTMVNSTVSGNRAIRGAGIALLETGSEASRGSENLNLLYTTVANNEGTGLLRLSNGDVSISHSIFAANGGQTGRNCEGSAGYSVSSYNLEDRGDCWFISTGDVTGVDPLLGPLTANGGPTLTQALMAGSPAIDAGLPRGYASEYRDQRGTPRPLGAATDIGAFEYGLDPAALRVIIPLRWENVFRRIDLTGASSFGVTLSLHGAAGGGTQASITGVTAGDGVGQLTYVLDKRGRRVGISGLALPSKPDANADPKGPVLFYLEVQRSIRGAAVLTVDVASCQCQAKPKKPAPIVIPPYRQDQ